MVIKDSYDSKLESQVETEITCMETVQTTEATQEIPEKIDAVVYNCHRLNLRQKPDMSSSVLSILNFGDKLCKLTKEDPLLIDNDIWMHVTTESGIEGYVMSAYVFI